MATAGVLIARWSVVSRMMCWEECLHHHDDVDALWPWWLGRCLVKDFPQV